MKTHRCTTADELPAVETVGDGLAAKIGGQYCSRGSYDEATSQLIFQLFVA